MSPDRPGTGLPAPPPYRRRKPRFPRWWWLPHAVVAAAWALAVAAAVLAQYRD